MSRENPSKTYSDYEKVIERLYQIGVYRRGQKTISALTQLHCALGQPAKRFPAVHVAGTNGKSSVARKIAAGLKAAGFKVGLYTSPHIISTCERITIDGEMISEKEVCDGLNHLFDLATQKNLRPTFFHYLTLLSAVYFFDNNIDVAVYEVGVGGKYDSTTSIISPELTVITSIGCDHMYILGPSINHIAQQKAGIIRPRVPVVLGPTARKDVIRKIAHKLDAPVTEVEPLDGNFEDENREIARVAMQQLLLPDDAIKIGAKTLSPCRFEEREYNGKPVIIDVAHNPDALKSLIKAVRVRYPGKKIHAIFGLAMDKDFQGCVDMIAPHVEQIHLPKIKHDRLADAQVIFDMCRRSNMCVCHDVEQCLEGAKDAELILVCGSFYIVKSVLASIKSTSSASG